MDNRHFIARRAAKYFKDGDVVNVGIGIPSICGEYAEPGVMFQTENGLIGVGGSPDELEDNERFYNAGGVAFVPVTGASAFDTAMSFGIIRSGRMSATVLGALQVSETGDLANWASEGRAFGMGGAMDLVNGAKKVIVAMEMCTKDGTPKIVPECSLPLTGIECVDHIVTECCVIDVTKEGLVVKEIRKGYTKDDIQGKTAVQLIFDPDIKIMEEDENE